VNYTLAGYFQKVMKMMMNSQPMNTLRYLFSNPEHLDNLVKHLYCNSIAGVACMTLNVRSDNASVLGSFQGLFQNIRGTNEEFFNDQSSMSNRLGVFDNVLSLCLDSADDVSLLEEHIGAARVLHDVIDNYDKISSGEFLIFSIFGKRDNLERLFAKTNPNSFNRIGSLAMIIIRLLGLIEQEPSKFKELSNH